jgi:hypothetical protein
MKTALAVAIVGVLGFSSVAAAGGGAVYKAWIDCPAHPRTHRAAVTVKISDTEARGFKLSQRKTIFVCT